MAVKKVQITIDEELLNRIDNYAEQNYLTRSGFFSTVSSQYLASREIVGALNTMSLAMMKIADKGEIDDETKEQLEDFERMAKLLSKGR